MTASFEVKVEGLDELASRLHDLNLRETVLGGLLNRLRFIVQKHVMLRAPVATGNLRRSVTSTYDPQALTATVGTNARYAYFVEKGTGLYGPNHARIYPKTRYAMRFIRPGTTGPTGTHRLSQVNRSGHPREWVFATSIAGMPAKPFFMPGWQDAQAEIQQAIEQAGAQATALMAGKPQP